MSKKFPSELRFDIVSKDWVVIATGRARRPETFRKEVRQHAIDGRKKCPFDTLDDQECPTTAFLKGREVEMPKGKVCVPAEWTTISVPNKYPAFAPRKSPTTRLM